MRPGGGHEIAHDAERRDGDGLQFCDQRFVGGERQRVEGKVVETAVGDDGQAAAGGKGSSEGGEQTGAGSAPKRAGGQRVGLRGRHLGVEGGEDSIGLGLGEVERQHEWRGAGPGEDRNGAGGGEPESEDAIMFGKRRDEATKGIGIGREGAAQRYIGSAGVASRGDDLMELAQPVAQPFTLAHLAVLVAERRRDRVDGLKLQRGAELGLLGYEGWRHAGGSGEVAAAEGIE